MAEENFNELKQRAYDEIRPRLSRDFIFVFFFLLVTSD